MKAESHSDSRKGAYKLSFIKRRIRVNLLLLIVLILFSQSV